MTTDKIDADVMETAKAAASEFFARAALGEGEADVIIDLVARALKAERDKNGWQPIATAPVNGPNFIAWVIDRIDEYDEDDRLVVRGKRVGSAVIAQCVSFTGGRGEVVEVPWKFVNGREYTHWMPLPPPPVHSDTKERRANALDELGEIDGEMLP